MIKILTSALVRLGVIKNALSSSRLEEINGENTLDFTAVLTSKLNSFIDENSIFEIDDDYFDIAFFKRLLNEDDTFTIEVESEHVSYRLNSSDFNVDYFTETGTPTYILGKILEGTGFTVGTVEFTDETTYSAQEAKSRRQLLMEFAATLTGELYFNKFEVSIVAHRGSSAVTSVLKDRNIKIVYKTVNKRELDDAGNPTVTYGCTPLTLPTQTYALGDNILLIQKDIGVQETLRVVRKNEDKYNKENTVFEFSNYTNGLESSLYRIQTESVSKDKAYNGIRIGPVYGFEAVRNDMKARAYFRSDGMKFQSGDGTGETWTDRLYYEYDSELDETFLVFDGKFSVRLLEAFGALIAQNLYATKGTIAELTVDQLDTADKVDKFLASDTSDVNYQIIYDQYHKFITASTDGLSYSQASNRNGELLYWVDETHEAATTDETDYPVYIYDYTETPKLMIAFELEGEYYVPKLILGESTGENNAGTAKIYKALDGFYLEYYHSETGEKYTLKITNDGVDFSGYPSMSFPSDIAIEGLVQIWVKYTTPLIAKEDDVWLDKDDYSRYDTLALTETYVLAEADPEYITATGDFTITLHTAVNPGVIKRISNIGTGLITLSGTIDGASGMILYPNESVNLLTDGSGWRS